jgi:hypothetical protein
LSPYQIKESEENQCTVQNAQSTERDPILAQNAQSTEREKQACIKDA